MTIEHWLDTFHAAWVSHDIPAVMNLFTDDVEYWETPHIRIGSKNELEQEWQVIHQQHDIQLQTKVYCSSPDNKHAVIWKLQYIRDGAMRQSGGTYLISLNDEGQCNFFHYVSSPKG